MLERFTNKQLMIIGGVGLVVGYIAYRKIAGTAEKLVTETLNPASNQNLIYDGIIGGTGRAISGDDSWSLGTWLYDLTHPDDGKDATATTPVPYIPLSSFPKG